MATETVNKNKIKISPLLLVLVLLAISLLRFPLMFVYPYPSGTFSVDFLLSSIEALSVFSIGMIILQYRLLIDEIGKNKLFCLSLGLIFTIAVLQFIQWSNYSFKEFCFTIGWIAIPLAVFLYADIFKKLITPFFAFLWCFNSIHLCRQLFYGMQSVGITGNRNWHGAFLIVSTPFFIYWLYRILKKKQFSEKLIFTLLVFPTAFSLWALYKAESRGANLALIVGIILLIGLFLFNSHDLKYKKFAYPYLFTIVFLAVAGTVCGVLFFGDKLAEMNTRDVRIPLWTGAWNMAFDNFWLGVSSPGYEGEYAYYIPIEKFLRSHYFAGRVTHPHNQLLYLAGSFGLLGLAAISYLWFFPIINHFRKFKRLDVLTKLILFAFLMLTIHSMFDLVMMQWPTMQMAFILQGLLWSGTFKQAESEASSVDVAVYPIALPLKLIFNITAVILLYSAFSMMRTTLQASYLSRNAKISSRTIQYPRSLFYSDKAFKRGKDAHELYNCGMKSRFWFGDYCLAYKYFKELENHPAKIVIHSNSRIAECLIKMGRKNEALPYFEKEIQVFPLSIIGLYNKLQLEMELGRKKDAEISADKLMKLLAFKGLKKEDLQRTIDNPGFDGRFDQLKVPLNKVNQPELKQ